MKGITPSWNFRQRYWLFAGNDHYARGGMDDFIGSYMLLYDALTAVESPARIIGEFERYAEWWHIFDSRTMSIVHKSPE